MYKKSYPFEIHPRYIKYTPRMVLVPNIFPTEKHIYVVYQLRYLVSPTLSKPDAATQAVTKRYAANMSPVAVQPIVFEA